MSQEISRREDNWKKYPYLYNQDKNLGFECQCGKKYLSFPGLYLHFQRKHGQKISMKPETNECQITYNESTITYKYHIMKKRAHKAQLMKNDEESEKETISSVLQTFMQQKLEASFNKPEYKLWKSFEPILDLFQAFLKNRISGERNKQEEEKSLLNDIPYFFNDFVQEDSSQTQLYGKKCQFLMEVYMWMKERGYTNLVVLYTELALTARSRIGQFADPQTQ